MSDFCHDANIDVHCLCSCKLCVYGVLHRESRLSWRRLNSTFKNSTLFEAAVCMKIWIVLKGCASMAVESQVNSPYFIKLIDCINNPVYYEISSSFDGRRGSSAVERATPGEEAPFRSPLWPPAPYRLGRCLYNVTGWDRSHGLPALSHVWQHVKLSDALVLGPVRHIT